MKKTAIRVTLVCLMLGCISCQSNRVNDGLYLSFPDFPFYLRCDYDIIGFVELQPRTPIVLMEQRVFFDYIRRCNELKDTIAIYQTWVQTTGQHIWEFETYIPARFPDFQPYIANNRNVYFQENPKNARRELPRQELAYIDESTWEHVKEIARCSYELRFVYNKWNRNR